MYQLQLMALNAMDRIEQRIRDQRGQGTMEYILIIAIVVVAVMALMWAFKDRLAGWIQDATNKIDSWK